MVDSHLTVKIVGWEYVVLYEAIRKTKQNRDKPEVQMSMLYHFKAAHDSSSRRGQPVIGADAGHSASRENGALRFAPELRGHGEHFEEPTRAGDVFNFGFIVGEIFERSNEGEGEVFVSLSQIDSSLHKSEQTKQDEGNNSRMPNKAKQIMNLAFSIESAKRPTFEQLEKSLRSAVGNGRGNLIDRYTG